MKKAIVIKTEDIDGDGKKDLSIYADEERIFTLFNVKKLIIEAAASGVAFFCALVGYTLVI